MFGDPVGTLLAWPRAGHDHKVLVAELVDRDIVNHATILVAHAGVAHLTGLHIAHFIDDQAIDQPLRTRSLDVHLAHGRQILHADIGAGVVVLLDGGGVG